MSSSYLTSQNTCLCSGRPHFLSSFLTWWHIRHEFSVICFIFKTISSSVLKCMNLVLFFPRKNSQCYIFREWKRSIIKDLGVSKLPCVIKFLLFDKSFHGLFISLARLSTLKQIQKSGLISHAQTYPREFSNATTKNFF